MRIVHEYDGPTKADLDVINIVNFVLLSLVKLGYFISCPAGRAGDKPRILTISAQLKLKLGLSLAKIENKIMKNGCDVVVN